MASIEEVRRKSKGNRKRGGKGDGTVVMYKVRYRDPERKQKARYFEKKADAVAFANSVETDINRDQYLDPELGKETVANWAKEWFATISHLKPKTVENYESLLRAHIIPKLGKRSLISVKPIDIRRVVSEMAADGKSASRIRQVRQLTSMIFDAAIENRAIAVNPVKNVKIPHEKRREMKVLTPDQVSQVLQFIPERDRALVYVLAYGGLRWGEAAALRRKRVNLLRSRIEIAESVSETGKGLHYGPPKTYQNRQVAIPSFLKEMLDDHMKAYTAKSKDALVFTTEDDTPMRNNNWRERVWYPALEEAGLPKVRVHDLRHTCATLLISQGAHAKGIQRHLGHSSIQVTFDIYGHLLPDEQDRVADALDETFRKSGEGN